MPPVETVAIKSQAKSGVTVINKEEFDEKKHTLAKGQASSEAKQPGGEGKDVRPQGQGK